MQYFQPSLSYHLSLRPLFCLILSGCLLYKAGFTVFAIKIATFINWKTYKDLDHSVGPDLELFANAVGKAS